MIVLLLIPLGAASYLITRWALRPLERRWVAYWESRWQR